MTSNELQEAVWRGKKLKIQDLSPSDILPFIDHINNLDKKGWRITIHPMHDGSVWHVLFTHKKTEKSNNSSASVHRPCYAHGFGEALRDAMKSAIKTALDPKEWPHIYT